MRLLTLIFLAVPLLWPAIVSANVTIDPCAYREQAYVDTLDRLAIGSTITNIVAGMPVVVEMTAAGLAVISVPISAPVAIGAISAATLFRSLNTYCRGSEPSVREEVTDMFCGLFGDCAEYSPL